MKKAAPLVSVLILTYNRTDLLKSCTDSVLKSDYPNLEFVISDNESSEDIEGFIRKNYSKQNIKVVRLKKNKGLTGGFNFGYKYCKGKYIMLLCNDIMIAKSCISNLVKIAENDPMVGAVAPKVVQMRNPKFIHSAGSFLTNTGLLYHYGVYQRADSKKYNGNYYIFSSTGAGFLVRRSTTEKTGLYSEDFFMAYDESDLCHRIWLGGYTIVYCGKAELQHYWSATMDPSNQNKLWYWNQRNILSSFIINFSDLYLFYFLIVCNIALIFWFFIRIIRGQFGLAWTLPKAYIWHILHLKQTLSKRKYVQEKIRHVSDWQILEKVMLNPNWRYYLIHLKQKYKDIELPKNVFYS